MGMACMRIAQVAPLYERVPPEGYGGTERVVAYLTDALIEQGHQVTLFASGDSITPARLAATCPRSLRLDDSCVDPLAPHLVMLERVFAEAHRFDVVHFHTGFLHFPAARRAMQPDCRRPRQLSAHAGAHWRQVVAGYTLLDVAYKVVGVSSVGLRTFWRCSKAAARTTCSSCSGNRHAAPCWPATSTETRGVTAIRDSASWSINRRSRA